MGANLAWRRTNPGLLLSQDPIPSIFTIWHLGLLNCLFWHSYTPHSHAVNSHTLLRKRPLLLYLTSTPYVQGTLHFHVIIAPEQTYLMVFQLHFALLDDIFFF